MSFASGRRLHYIKCDVTSPESVSSAVDLGSQVSPSPIRGLVTCAGISARFPATSYLEDFFKHILDVNVTGTFLCAQAVARHMHERMTPGGIVLVASMSVTIADIGVETVAYSSSRAAVLQTVQYCKRFAISLLSGETMEYIRLSWSARSSQYTSKHRSRCQW